MYSAVTVNIFHLSKQLHRYTTAQDWQTRGPFSGPQILGEQWNVLIMPNHRLIAIHGALNFHNIETKSFRLFAGAEPPEIIRASTQHHPLLGLIDRMVSGNKRLGRAGLDLNKDQSLLIPANQVNFITPVARTAPVTGNDFETAFFAQKRRRQPLSFETSPSVCTTRPVRLPPLFKT